MLVEGKTIPVLRKAHNSMLSEGTYFYACGIKTKQLRACSALHYDT